MPLQEDSWIVTLDVLKYYYLLGATNSTLCWIVTLDVLKFISIRNTTVDNIVE